MVSAQYGYSCFIRNAIRVNKYHEPPSTALTEVEVANIRPGFDMLAILGEKLSSWLKHSNFIANARPPPQGCWGGRFFGWGGGGWEVAGGGGGGGGWGGGRSA